MARRPPRPQRVADRKQVDVIAAPNRLTAARTPRRSRSAPKDRTADRSPACKVSPGRGRPALLTREDILKAAKVAFSKTGYANVTLDDLAARLNTGKGTLYYHSNRKVDLLIAISTTAVGNSVTELRKIASIKAPPQHRLALAIRLLMHGVIGDQQASKVYFENESDLPPKFRADLRRQLRGIQNAFADLVGEGVTAGVFRGDPKIVAKHILSVCAWPYRWFSANGMLSLDAFIDSAVRFVLGGVLADPKADRVIEAALTSPTGRKSLTTRPTGSSQKATPRRSASIGKAVIEG